MTSSKAGDVPVHLDKALSALDNIDGLQVRGRVLGVRGLTIAAAIPGLRLGEIVEIERRDGSILEAEVVGFELDEATLLPLGTTRDIGPDDAIRPLGRGAQLQVSDKLLGRVLDGLGRPLDGRPLPEGQAWPLHRPAPNALSRPPINQALSTGVRAIDALMTLGEGQRIGLFAGSGVGKSTLLGEIARRAQADVVVVGLVGERSREVREFIEDCLGPALAKSVVVCATGNEPALIRMRSAWTATAIAEYFREKGARVLLLMDSVTRFARAAREVGLAASEPPARRGYPPSVFAALPQLLERGGLTDKGSITAIYSVLVEGGDLDEPISDEVRGLLDGHIILDRKLALRGRWPAIDPLHSLSRVMDRITKEPQQLARTRLLEMLSTYESKRDLVLLGAYEEGADPRLDKAMARIEAIERFLRQPRGQASPMAETLAELERLVR